MNRTLQEMLRSYVASDQSDWSEHLACAEFAVNNAWQASVQNTPFFLNYGQHPRMPVAVPVAGGQERVPAADAFARSIERAVAQARDCLLAAQQRMAAYYNSSHRQVAYEVGQEVLLSTANMRFMGKNVAKGARKLRPRWVGPFKVIELIGSVAVRLELHDGWRNLHPVFHVSLVKPYVPGTRLRPAPPPVDWDDGAPLWRIERVLDHRDVVTAKRRKPTREYKIRWEGYSESEDTWEPRSNLVTCEPQVRQYHEFAGLPPPPDAWFR
jgi:hypothetical protein